MNDRSYPPATNSTTASCFASCGGCLLAAIPVTIVLTLLLVPLFLSDVNNPSRLNDFWGGFQILATGLIAVSLAGLVGTFAGGVAAVFTFKHAQRTRRFPRYAIAGYLLGVVFFGGLWIWNDVSISRSLAQAQAERDRQNKYNAEAAERQRNAERKAAEKQREFDKKTPELTIKARKLLGYLWYPNGLLYQWEDGKTGIPAETISVLISDQPFTVLKHYAELLPEGMLYHPLDNYQGMPSHLVCKAKRPGDGRPMRVHVSTNSRANYDIIVTFDCGNSPLRPGYQTFHKEDLIDPSTAQQ